MLSGYGAALSALLLMLLPAQAQLYGYGRMMSGYFMSPSIDGPSSSYVSNPNIPLDERIRMVEMRKNQQIQMLQERIEQLEKEVDSLRRISLHDWNATDSGSLFKVFGGPKNWNEAENTCKSYGAKLASIDSDKRNNYVLELIHHQMGDIGIVDGFGDMEVWIGLKAKAEMSTSASRFTNFAEDERIDGCAVMDSKGKWKIRPCSSQHPFVCQQVDL